MSTRTAKPGQLWEDMDPRMGGRRIRVTKVNGSYVYAVVEAPSEYSITATTGRPVRILLSRMRPTRQGYRLIEDGADA